MHSRIFYLLLSLFLLIQASLIAQSNVENNNLKSNSLSIKKDLIVVQDTLLGSLFFTQDKRLNDLLKLDTLISFSKQGFNGYRIQIYSESSIDSSVDQAHDYLKAFEEQFPNLRVYLNYYDPDFKIRVGNFRNKVECEGIIRKVKKIYPNCYTVRTFIFFKDLIAPMKEEVRIKDSLLLEDGSTFVHDSIKINQTLNKSNTNE